MLDGDAVEVDVVTGSRRVPLDEVAGARTVDGWLLPRLVGVSTSGYHAGSFHLTGHGRVAAYASRVRGPFVLLEREGEVPLVVSPAEPDAFLAALRERSGALA